MFSRLPDILPPPPNKAVSTSAQFTVTDSNSSLQIPAATLAQTVSHLNPAFRGVFGAISSFNEYQQQFMHLAFQTESFFLTAPTGSGKSLLLAAATAFTLQQNGKVAFIVPTKALIEQTYQYLKRGLQLTSISQNCESDNTQVAILTPEKALMSDNQYNLVILDEIHTCADHERGWIYQLLIQRCKPLVFAQKLRLIAVSATYAGDLHTYANLKLYQVSSQSVSTSSLLHCCIKQNFFAGYFSKAEVKKQLISIHSLLSSSEVADFGLFDGFGRLDKQCLIFLPTRELVEYAALSFVAQYKTKHLTDEIYVLNQQLRKLIIYSVAFHHAGLAHTDRQLIEQEFANNKIKILFSTSTLAVGVNLNPDIVVIFGTLKYQNGFINYSADELAQMKGRCGRTKPGFCLIYQHGAEMLDFNQDFKLNYIYPRISIQNLIVWNLSEGLKKDEFEKKIKNSYYTYQSKSVGLQFVVQQTDQVVQQLLSYKFIVFDNEGVKILPPLQEIKRCFLPVEVCICLLKSIHIINNLNYLQLIQFLLKDRPAHTSNIFEIAKSQIQETAEILHVDFAQSKSTLVLFKQLQSNDEDISFCVRMLYYLSAVYQNQKILFAFAYLTSFKPPITISQDQSEYSFQLVDNKLLTKLSLKNVSLLMHQEYVDIMRLNLNLADIKQIDFSSVSRVYLQHENKIFVIDRLIKCQRTVSVQVFYGITDELVVQNINKIISQLLQDQHILKK